jgi:hypothetical protein
MSGAVVCMSTVRVTLLAVAAALMWLALSGPAAADTTVTARLHPINGSGVHGTATVTARDDGSLTVVIHGSGYAPGLPHAQHLHGSIGGGHFMCPTMKDDTNGDGVVTNEEGAGEYGTIFMPLTTRGDTSPKSGLALKRMPVADSAGRIDYRRTFTPAEVPDSLIRHLSDVHIVQHGIDHNGNGRYDMAALGVSTFAKNLGIPGVPEEVTDPAACGVLTGAMSPAPPHGGVETGGGTGHPVNLWLAGLGASLVGGCGLLLARRPRRAE